MIRRKFFYIQAHRGHFHVRIHGEARTVQRACAGLEHPRTLAGDFYLLQKTLAGIFKELRTPAMWFVKPDALVHLMHKAEGGYTNIELRAFREATAAAGGRRVYLCDDKYGPLNDRQLVELVNALR